MKTTFEIKGASEYDAMLKELPGAAAGRVGNNALRAGARVISAEAKRQVPVETGDLKRSIKVRTIRASKRRLRMVAVGVRGVEGPLAHLIEFGTSAHVIKPKDKKVLADVGADRIFGPEVHHPGIKPRSFLRVAADTKAAEALDKIGEILGKGIEREALKMGRGRVLPNGRNAG